MYCKILQNSQYIKKSKFNKNYYENKVNDIFIHESIVYRDLYRENEIFQNYSSTMVHSRQWGVQHDIPVKMTHVTTEEEMKERHDLVKKTTPCATPN